MGGSAVPAASRQTSHAWLWWLVVFAGFSVLALADVIPKGPIGDWVTPWWADILLAPFSGAVMLLLALATVIARQTGRLEGGRSVIAGRIVFALVAATAAEVVLKAAFPGSAGVLGAVSVGPFEFGFYPSGHSLRATIVAISLVVLGPVAGPARWLFLGLPLLVGTALVCAGGHFPVDVAGGILLGTAAATWALAPAVGRRTAV